MLVGSYGTINVLVLYRELDEGEVDNMYERAADLGPPIIYGSGELQEIFGLDIQVRKTMWISTKWEENCFFLSYVMDGVAALRCPIM